MYHVQRLDVSFDNVELADFTGDDYIIEKSTVDKDTAFKNAWILIIKPLVENMCLEQAKKVEIFKFQTVQYISMISTIN